MMTVEEVHREHSQAVLSFLQKMGQSPQDAEDIVQETMLRAWKNIASLRNTEVRPWLFTVAKRVMINEYRKQRARPKLVAENLWEGGVADAGLDRVINLEIVAEALVGLSREHREVLILRFVLGLSHEEVADRLGIPGGTAKSRVYYALRAARRAIDGKPAYDTSLRGRRTGKSVSV